VVLRIVSQVASALACTHEKKIVHRDLKPENIFLVTATGEKDFVKVLDFGVSKVHDAGPRLTAKNVVIGTPSYMAPEQARAGRDVDGRADQFALAAMVYEMLCGMRPFAGEEPAEVLLNVLTVGAPNLASVAEWVPETVAEVVHRGLSKDVGDRFDTISEFAVALEVATTNAGRSVTFPPDSLRKTEPQAGPPDFSIDIKSAEPAQPPKPRIYIEGRTPPAPDAAHLVEHFAPISRDRTPGARRPPSAPAPEQVAIRPVSRPAPLTLESAPPSQRRPLAITPGSRPPHEGSTPTTPAPTSAPPLSERSAARAEQLFQTMRTSMRNGRVDDAVLQAEKLLEHAIIGKDPAIYEVLRRAMPFVDHVFETRVGPVERKLEVTALGRENAQLNLSPKAATLLTLANGLTVAELLTKCGVPRRDAIRMLAGLLRRRALIAV
jgi:serine/threonine-protein kinase